MIIIIKLINKRKIREAETIEKESKMHGWTIERRTNGWMDGWTHSLVMHY